VKSIWKIRKPYAIPFGSQSTPVYRKYTKCYTIKKNLILCKSCVMYYMKSVCHCIVWLRNEHKICDCVWNHCTASFTAFFIQQTSGIHPSLYSAPPGHNFRTNKWRQSNPRSDMTSRRYFVPRTFPNDWWIHIYGCVLIFKMYYIKRKLFNTTEMLLQYIKYTRICLHFVFS
jgi:hypothetical protein